MSLMPSKSMPLKSNHDFKGKYSYIPVGTFEPMRREGETEKEGGRERENMKRILCEIWQRGKNDHSC